MKVENLSHCPHFYYNVDTPNPEQQIWDMYCNGKSPCLWHWMDENSKLYVITKTIFYAQYDQIDTPLSSSFLKHILTN